MLTSAPGSQCRVLIVYSLVIFLHRREIGSLYGIGKDLIVYKLLYGWQLRSASLPIFVEASGEWAYPLFAPDVGEKMRLQFMCFVTASMLLRYGFIWFHLILLLIFLPLIAGFGYSITSTDSGLELTFLAGRQLS
jgi:hypothetical protein